MLDLNFKNRKKFPKMAKSKAQGRKPKSKKTGESSGEPKRLGTNLNENKTKDEVERKQKEGGGDVENITLPSSSGINKDKGEATTTTEAVTLGSSMEKTEMYCLDKEKKKFVSVSEMENGKVVVNIREYYEKDGKKLPTKRNGITLHVEQWEELKKYVENVDQDIKKYSK